MCGIAGVFSLNRQNVKHNTLQNMANSLAHRGPDGEGFYINPTGHVGFAHRRLSIIDLSNAGQQPMHYVNRYTIIHNGEIYNYEELKDSLQKQGYTFSSLTDTEVIVAAYDKYKENCVQYFDGMFAFAIWDEQEKSLFAARDRFGEKPFYYYVNDQQVYFASEMKALWNVGIPKEINHSLMCLFLGLGYTSIPLEPQYTFYKDVFSLPAAHYIKLQLNVSQNTFTVTQNQYWDIDKETTTNISEEDAIEQFAILCSDAIKKRLRSDVAIGTSLSGGLDSSSIAAFLHQIGVNTYQTFSAIFPGFLKNEADYINIVTENYHLSATYCSPDVEGFITDFNTIINIQEQPFASSSIYAQYKVFELAKKNNTKVVLDGQGADETLAGYDKYTHWYLQELYLYNKKLFKEEFTALRNNGKTFSWSIANNLAAWFPAAASTRLERNAVNQLRSKNNLTQDYIQTHFSRLFIHKPFAKKLNDILYHNTMQFGLEELLRYADKNAMANSVEVRLPFLQHDLVQFVFSLPSHYKIHNGFSKYILRKAVDPILPSAITWRKDKIGYETPQNDWLQHHYFVEKVDIAKKLLINNGIMDKKIVHSKTTIEQNWRMLIAAAYL